MSRHWVVAGGGTGGHVTLALALAERIRARGDEVLVLGAQRGLEMRLVPEAGFPLVALPSQPVVGRGVIGSISALASLLRASLSAWSTLRSHGAEIVVSVGGYAAVPALLAAALRRLPIALVEPNAIPGRTNRLAGRLARRVFVQFPRAAQMLGPERSHDVGIPLRGGLLEAFAGAGARRVPEPPFRLLVAGGSQGAQQINDAMIQAAGKLDAERVEVFHQSGEADRERVEQGYRDAGVRAQVVAFETDMPGRYRWADVALCRAGALTVAELALAGLPALLVPYPYAADDHQAANAQALAEAGAARVLDPRPLAPERVVEALGELFSDPDGLVRMGERAAALARPEAGDRIVEECAGLLPGAGR